MTLVKSNSSIAISILDKLIYYNKVSKLNVPVLLVTEKYTETIFQPNKRTQAGITEHIFNSDFYRYQRSGRDDRDQTFFRLGNINLQDGLNSFF
jgi:hypothetical protein